MKHHEYDWQTEDNIQIFSQAWGPAGKLKAVLVLIHGLGEHSGRYAHLGEVMSEHGYALMGFDLRGHGRSQGQRGHTPSYGALLDDISLFTNQVAERHPQTPVFLYGHSLGGSLVLNYPLQRATTITGVVSSAPWLRLAFEPPPVKVILGRLMDRIWPTFSQANGLEIEALSRDPEVVQKYKTDPLVHDRISARLYVAFSEAGQWALDHAEDFPVPLLLMQGSDDRLISREACHKFAARAGVRCTFKIWNDLYHEIHNEFEQDAVFEYMIHWLDNQIQ